MTSSKLNDFSLTEFQLARQMSIKTNFSSSLHMIQGNQSYTQNVIDSVLINIVSL